MHVYFLKLDPCSEASLHRKHIKIRNKAVTYLYTHQLQISKITLHSVKGTAYQRDGIRFSEKELFILLQKIMYGGPLSG